jgi:hypothetical protein
MGTTGATDVNVDEFDHLNAISWRRNDEAGTLIAALNRH